MYPCLPSWGCLLDCEPVHHHGRAVQWVLAPGFAAVLALGCLGGEGLEPHKCTSDFNCELGFQCLADAGSPYGSICSTECQHDQCNRLVPEGGWHGQECVNNECKSVECGYYVECESGEDICVPRDEACYPRNGRCEDTSDCPVYRDLAKQCVDGFCHVIQPSDDITDIQGLDPEASEPSVVVTPKSGDIFSSTEEVSFEVDTMEPGHALLLVFTEAPKSADTILDSAVWGLSFRRNETLEARFSDGMSIVDGQWQAFEDKLIPRNQALYFLVQVVDGGQLMEVSRVIVFRIDDEQEPGEPAWPEPGAECQEGGDNGNQCVHPAVEQVCLSGACAVACLANRDCGDGFLCSDPQGEDPVRVCIPRDP